MWEILDTGTASAARNMQIDDELLEKAALSSTPILHFYRWARPSVTYGYFIDPVRHLHLDVMEQDGLDFARRPTGGGIVFHLWDLAFSVIVPSKTPFFSENTLTNYAFINSAVARAARAFIDREKNAVLIPEDVPALDEACANFCMARPTKYDVVLQGRKIAGAAQRQKKQGYLHQGTISLKAPSIPQLGRWLQSGSRVLEAMQAHTFALLSTDADEEDLEEARGAMQDLLYQSLTEQSYKTSYAT
jgi:lipoate---protein ligase